MHPNSQHMIAGDFNGDVQTFPTLKHLCDEGEWVDLGANAELWGGASSETTCHASSKAKQTRRDFVFVNQRLLPAVAGCRVARNDVFPTHWPVQVKLASDKLCMQYQEAPKNDQCGGGNRAYD